MPSRALIKAAARAAAQPAPTIGNGVSPLIGSYGGAWGATRYGTALPRPPEDFLTGAFGPLTPISPVAIDQPQPGSDRPEPRRWQYPVGWNMPIGQPGSEGLKLADFNTLRTLADLYSVARTCIQLRKSEIRSLAWDIIPTADAQRSMRGKPNEHADFGERRAKAVGWWRCPDAQYGSFRSWLDALLEDVFVIDALSLYLQPTRARGKGMFGSSLGQLCLIDGSMIRPLVDMQGSRPRPPDVAYQQYAWGVPRTDLMTVATGADGDDLGDLKAEYRGDQLLYLPYTPRTWSPYGMAPIERAIVPVMAGLYRQQYQLQWFDESTVPNVFVSPGDPNMTPQQIANLQSALNAIAGDPAWKHKIIVLPGQSRVDPMKPTELADQFDEIIMTQVTMSFDVMPMELGIAPKVSTTQSVGAANQMAKASQSIHERKSLKPMLMWLKDNIFDLVIQQVWGQTDMQWTWEGLEEGEDAEALTNILTRQIATGIISVDEARAELQMPPWGLPETSDPLIVTATGAVPLGAINPATGTPEPGQTQPDPNQPAAPAGTATQQAPPPPAQQPKPKPGNAPGGTPGHAAADAAADAAEAAKLPAKTAKVPSKAALAELDALGRHLRKGRRISTWQARHLPAHTLAVISEDLAKGLTVGQAIDVARSTLPADSDDQEGEQPPLHKDDKRDWHAWRVDEKLAALYAARIRRALSRVLGRDTARRIAEEWLRAAVAGRNPAAWLQTNQPALADEITAALRAELTDLWRQAWAVGHAAADAARTGETSVDWPGLEAAIDRAAHHGGPLPDIDASLMIYDRQSLEEWLAHYGIDTIRSVADTRLDDLASLLEKALAAGESPDALAAEIEALGVDAATADMIAITEISRAVSQAALANYQLAGVRQVTWLTSPDLRVCDRCLQNESASPIPLGDTFPGGTDSPPQHPRCRCSVVPAEIAGVALPSIGALAGLLLSATPDLTKGGDAGRAVYEQMLEDYPPEAIEWVKKADWSGPEDVPLDQVDFSNQEEWQAAHEPAKVERFKRKIAKRVRKGKPVKPVILVKTPQNDDLIVIDGHHRSLAYKALDLPIRGFVGQVDAEKGPWLHTHRRQYDENRRTTTDDPDEAQDARLYRRTPAKKTTDTPEHSPFDHDTHPRRRESGQFVNRGDVDQAMRRVHDGRQTSRNRLPRPAKPEHPNAN